MVGLQLLRSIQIVIKISLFAFKSFIKCNEFDKFNIEDQLYTCLVSLCIKVLLLYIIAKVIKEVPHKLLRHFSSVVGTEQSRIMLENVKRCQTKSNNVEQCCTMWNKKMWENVEQRHSFYPLAAGEAGKFRKFSIRGWGPGNCWSMGETGLLGGLQNLGGTEDFDEFGMNVLRHFQESSKHSIQFFIFTYHSDFHGNIGCS